VAFLDIAERKQVTMALHALNETWNSVSRKKPPRA